MSMYELYRMLRPLRLRIYLNNLIYCILIGLCGGMGIIAILFIAAIFIPITFIFAKSVIILMMSIFASLVASMFLIPDYKKTAQQGDELGLKERLTTALELEDEQTPIARIQRYDAIKAVELMNFSQRYPIKIDYRKVIAIFSMLIIAFVSFFIPSQSKTIAKQDEKIKVAIKQQVEEVKKEQKKVSSNTNLTLEELKTLELQLKKLEKDLKKSNTESEAIKALSRSQNKLNEIQKENLDKDLSKLGEEFSKFESTKELGEALKNGMYDELEKRIDEFAKHLENMDSKNLEKLAENIEQLAQEISKNPKLADALNQLAQNMQSGKASQNLANLNALAKKMAQSSAMRQAVQQLEGAMQQSKANISNASPGQLQNPTLVSRLNPSSSNNSGSQNGSGGQGNGSGNSGGQGDGNGSETGNGGQGNGNGTGNGTGGGAGSGTGNGSDGVGSGGSGGSGQGKVPGQKKVKNYEQIFTPKRLGGDGEISNVNGTQNNSGQVTQMEVEDGPKLRGESVPYNEVYQEYKYEAMQSVQRSTIPKGMRNLVEEYFSSLE